MDRYKKEFLAKISSITKTKKIDFLINHDLSLFSTMRLRAIGDIFIVRDENILVELLKILYSYNQEYIILGIGANVLLPEKCNLPYVQIKFPFDKTILTVNGPSPGEYTLPASLALSVLSSHAVKFGLSGWEKFTGIPASLGGAIYMNAGTKLGEIGELVKKVTILTKKGERKSIVINSESFSYRKNNFTSPGDIIIDVTIKYNGISTKITEVIKDYLALRNSTQPLKAFTCGCIFKNASSCIAGKMIDSLGLKGLRFGGVQVSHKHANFMENIGGGVRSDVVNLIQIIQCEVLLNFCVKLETEVIMHID